MNIFRYYLLPKSTVLKLSNQKHEYHLYKYMDFNTKISILLMLYSHLHHHSASQRHNIKDRCMKDNAWRRRRKEDAGRNYAWRKTREGKRRKLLYNIFTSHFIARFERVVQGLHVRGCWRPNINFIFWPQCYDRHVVSFLFSWCWGPLHQGFSEGPLGRVWLSLPHLVSRCQEFYWQLLWQPKLNWVK